MVNSSKNHPPENIPLEESYVPCRIIWNLSLAEHTSRGTDELSQACDAGGWNSLFLRGLQTNRAFSSRRIRIGIKGLDASESNVFNKSSQTQTRILPTSGNALVYLRATSYRVNRMCPLCVRGFETRRSDRKMSVGERAVGVALDPISK